MLTNEQISSIESTCWDGPGFGARFDRWKFARAIESAAFAERDKLISELERELAENQRLNGMGSEREAALMSKVEQLERELEAVRKDVQWRPIETAPRDKTIVALLRLNGDGSFTYGYGYYVPMDGWRCWAHHEYKPPTHWMPLPPAPDAAKEQG